MPAREWKSVLKTAAASEDMTKRLRLHTRTGRPLGDDTFLSKVESCLGRRIRTLPRGRLKGSKDKQKRTRREGTNQEDTGC